MATSERLPMTPRMQQTLSRAEAIALDRGAGFVGTEHVLLAFLDDERGIAGGTIHRLGFGEAVRAEVIRIIESVGYRTPSREVRRFSDE